MQSQLRVPSNHSRFVAAKHAAWNPTASLCQRCYHSSSRRNHASLMLFTTSATAGPTAVITGCSTGIGRETALLLAQKGWHVFAGARSDADLQDLGNMHNSITPIKLDVTSQESVAAAQQSVHTAVQQSGLQLLINNAGIGAVSPVEFFDMNIFRDVMEVNFMGAVTTTQAFIPLLRQGQQKGRIINVSSVAGHLTMPVWSAYCSSKHALESFSDCLRYELESFGVPVVVVKPGPVATPIWQKSRAKSTVEVGPKRFAAALEVYGDMIRGMNEQTKRSEASAIPVDQVVQVIYEAATSPKPAHRYHVGRGAATTYWAKRLLPDWVWEGLMNRYFKKAYAEAAPSTGEDDFLVAAGGSGGSSDSSAEGIAASSAGRL